MRRAATASACLLAATLAGAAAEPPSTKGRAAPAEVHASLPDAKTRGRGDARDAGRDGWRPPRGRVCFNQADTRDNIAAHGLSDPLHALQVGRLQGEALSARLCRWPPDEYVYEIQVLRGDGRVLRVYMNAQNGALVGGPSVPERDKAR